MLQKTSESDIFRDESTGALINTNVNAYRLYKKQRENSKTIDDLNKEVNVLHTEVNELKILINRLLENKNV